MAGERANRGAAAATAIPNATSAPSPSQQPSQTREPPINPLHISDEQGANTYKHLLRESVRLHPDKAPSFENIAGGDSALGSVDGSNNGAAAAADALGASSSSPLIPFSRLKFIRKVGSGAFAKVDICEYRTADGNGGFSVSKVAVKRLTPGVSVLGMVDLAVEARLLRTLHHPYITGFIGVGKDDKGQGFLVEEFVDGEEKKFLFVCLFFLSGVLRRKRENSRPPLSFALFLSLPHPPTQQAAPSTVWSPARPPSPTRPSTPTPRRPAGRSRSPKPWRISTAATPSSSTAT